jgi:hypothetical protein
MAFQSEIVGVEKAGYHLDGMIYVIHGKRLYQVDHNYFVEFMPGNSFYGDKVRQLKKLSPMPHSELKPILSKLTKTIEDIM